jgi:hypothetical protein
MVKMHASHDTSEWPNEHCGLQRVVRQ